MLDEQINWHFGSYLAEAPCQHDIEQSQGRSRPTVTLIDHQLAQIQKQNEILQLTFSRMCVFVE